MNAPDATATTLARVTDVLDRLTLDNAEALAVTPPVEGWPAEASHRTNTAGQTLASWLVSKGARWGTDGQASRTLLRLCEAGLDCAVPDPHGSLPAVDAWGDVDERLTEDMVAALAAAHVDFAAVRLDNGWSALSEIRTDRPPTERTLERIREETVRSLERLTPRERGLRLKRMDANVHPRHRSWFDAVRQAFDAEAAMPPAVAGGTRARM